MKNLNFSLELSPVKLFSMLVFGHFEKTDISRTKDDKTIIIKL